MFKEFFHQTPMGSYETLCEDGFYKYFNEMLESNSTIPTETDNCSYEYKSTIIESKLGSLSHECLVLFEEEILKSQDKFFISRQCVIKAILIDETFTPQFKQLLNWSSEEKECKTYGDLLDLDISLLINKSEEFGVIIINRYLQSRLLHLKEEINKL